MDEATVSRIGDAKIFDHWRRWLLWTVDTERTALNLLPITKFHETVPLS